MCLALFFELHSLLLFNHALIRQIRKKTLLYTRYKYVDGYFNLMPIEIRPREMNIDIGSPVNRVAMLGSRVWAVAKWPLLIGAIIGIPLAIFFIIKWIKNRDKTPQDTIREDLEESAFRNRESNVEGVYIYKLKGFDYLGEYRGHISREDLQYVYVRYSKGSGKSVMSRIFRFLPSFMYDLFFDRTFLVAVPSKSVMKSRMVFPNKKGKDKRAFVFTAEGLEFKSKTGIYQATGHIGFPKRVIVDMLEDAEESYLQDFVKKTAVVIDSALEINPFVRGKLKLKQETEENPDDEADE